MVTLRVCSAAAALAAAAVSSLSARAAVPDYKLGEIAREDVITPVPLLVVNPEATEALKQKVAQQVNPVVRHARPTAAEAEAELRAAITRARTIFLAGARGAAPDSPVFVSVLREVTRLSTHAKPQKHPQG